MQLKYKLLTKITNHRDNGTTLIGSYICFPCPLVVDLYILCDIPMISSHVPVILLKYPTRVSAYQINDESEAKNPIFFPTKVLKLSINFSAPMKISCSGNLCDRQRVTYWLCSKGCCYYGMFSNRTSLVIQYAITVQNSSHGPFHMNDFFFVEIQQVVTEW